MFIRRKLLGRIGSSLAVALLTVPMLAACGAEATPTTEPATPTPEMAAQPAPTEAVVADTPTPSDASTGTKLKIGLVTDVGRLNDKSFNQSSWEGVVQAEKELGAEVKYIETTDLTAYEKNIQQFIDDKYDVIVTVGFALGEATTKVAKENPNVKFIGVDQFQAEMIPNLAGLTFEEDKAGYLAGVLAASISKNKNIGAICGPDTIPPVWRFCEGYKHGAASVDPATKVQFVYNNVDLSKAFDDPVWGKTSALSMISSGADVLFGAGGKTGNGAIYAAKEMDLPAIGVDADQYLTIGPEYQSALASSAMKLLTPGVFNLLKTVQDGSFKGGNNVGPVGLAPYHDWETKIDDAVKAKITEVDKGLQDGTIKTCVSPVKEAPSPCGDAMPPAPGGEVIPGTDVTPTP